MSERDKMTISQLVRKIRKERGLTQEEFGKILGVTGDYVSQVERGRKPGVNFLVSLSKNFGISLSSLLERSEYILTRSDKDYLIKVYDSLTPEEKRKVLNYIITLKRIPIRKIPVLGYVKAGEPYEVKDDSEPVEIIELPSEETESTKFALIVRGDSMKEKGIEEGDYLLLNPDLQVESGDLVVAIIDGKATFKVFRRVNGKVYLEPANNNYKRIELKEGMDVKLIKVTGVWTRKR